MRGPWSEVTHLRERKFASGYLIQSSIQGAYSLSISVDVTRHPFEIEAAIIGYFEG